MKIIKNKFMVILIISVLSFSAYSFMLGAPFRNYDDNFSIVNNPVIKDVKNIDKIFTSSFFGAGHYYRPLVTFSNMIEYMIFGLNPFYFHLTNLILHILIAIKIYYLFRILLKNNTGAFFVSLLFSIHPINSEVVASIPDRSILLSTFFALSAFLLFCMWSKKKGVLFLLLSLFAFVLSLMSKESAAMLPVVLFGYGLIISEDKTKMFSFSFRKTLPYFVVLGVFILARNRMGIVEVFGWGSIKAQTLAVISFLRATLTFLRLFILPVDLYFDRGQELFTSFASIELLITILMWVGILVLYLINKKNMPSIVKFLIFWAVLELIPVSQLVAAIGLAPGYISVGERLFYGASIPIIALIVIGLQKLIKEGKEKKILSKPSIRIFVFGSFLFMFLSSNLCR